MTATENTQQQKNAPNQKQGATAKKTEADAARENSPLVRFLDSAGPLFAPIFMVVGYFFKALHWTLSLVFSEKMMKGIDAFFGKMLDSLINDEIVGILTGMVLMAVVVWGQPDPLKDLGTLNWCRQVEGIEVVKIARHYRIPLERAAAAKGNCLRFKFEGKMEADPANALGVDTEKSAEDVTWDEKTREFEEQREESLKQKALNPKMELKEDDTKEVNPDDYIDF